MRLANLTACCVDSKRFDNYCGIIPLNLKQLSDVLGLSQTTISRALNGYPEVNSETRLRVEKAARKHGYTPNKVAQRLATGRARAIGHVVPLSEHDMFNPLFADFIAGAGDAYSKAGYNMLLSVVEPDDEFDSYRDLAASSSVDGFIVHAPRMQDPRIEMLNELGMPYLVHGRVGETTGYSWLDFNNQRAFEQATQLLLDLGHRKIALLNGQESMSFAHRRRLGFEAALKSAGIQPDPALIFGEDMTEPFGFDTASALLRRPDPVSAILTSSLISAIGVARAISEAGLTIGRDVSVITHDDAMSFLPNGTDRPVFTSTKSSIRLAGKKCAEILIDLIEGRITGHQSELWDAELIEGTSTGPHLH